MYIYREKSNWIRRGINILKVSLSARIFLRHSLSPSLSPISLSLSLSIGPYHTPLPTSLPKLHLVLAYSLRKKNLASTSMSRVSMKYVTYEFVLPYPECLVRLTWMVFEMGGKWPLSCFLMRSYVQDLVNITHNILVYFPPIFFSMR